ncbi:DEKNAAC101940 [Brettanomyces naardenensis]|uniref:Methionine aminopeptidase n=1 Tax=Brettanomyces naardenensis TaxID=13370 RepID=A0A448YJH2_BRENA|nr:DEKNAAC101940 [Brettanomyces naardenensis]
MSATKTETKAKPEDDYSETADVRYCASPLCGKRTTSNLKCPVCLKNGIEQYFCNSKCFREAWHLHKACHPKEGCDSYNPYPEFEFSGEVRPTYPLTIEKHVPESIERPDYARDGKPVSEMKNDRTNKVRVLSPEEIKKMRIVCKLGREVLDAAAAAIRPGITTEDIDKIIYEESVKRKAYPSPLNYFNYPKSVCVSVNEVICHGIPDKSVLKDGDIVNLDVTIYKFGLHADLNETYYVGEKAKQNKELVNLVETTREATMAAIATVKPGMPFRHFGDVIEKHAKENGVSVVRTYVGHGINNLFHCQPDIMHYARNKAVGTCKAGICFTIEPMLNMGTYRDIIWPDNWTATTADGKPSAQFEHTLLVTEDGVEILTARNKHSPGGPVKRLQ